MIIHTLMFVFVAVASLAVTGCDRQAKEAVPPPVEAPPAPRPPDAPDFSRLLNFHALDRNTHTKVDKALTAADKGDYPTVLRELQLALQDPRLSADQRQTLRDVIDQVEKFMAKAGVAGDIPRPPT